MDSSKVFCIWPPEARCMVRRRLYMNSVRAHSLGTVPQLSFEFIYDVCLLKWNTGTVRIIAEYDVAGGVAGIMNN